MRKILLLLVAVIFCLDDLSSAQNRLIYRSSVPDSATILQITHRRVDSLSRIIPITQDSRKLPGLYLTRGAYEGVLNQPDSAIADYTRALALNPQMIKAYSLRGAQYQKVKNYEAGIADDQKAIPLFKNNPTGLALLYGNIGFMQFRLKQYKDVLKTDSISLALNPNNDFVYINSGWAYLHFLKYNDGIECFTAALNLMPHTDANKRRASEVLLGRGQGKAALKKYKEAINDYSLAINLNPDNRVARWDRAGCYNDNGDYELADAEYTQTIAYFKGDSVNLAKLYDDRAVTEISQQKPAEALQDDSIALTYNSQYPPACWNRANAYANNGDCLQSINWYTRTMKYYPANENNNAALADLNDAIAGNAFVLARYDDVIGYTSKAIDLNKLAWSPHLNRGRAYLKQMKNDLATDDFNKVLALDTTKQSFAYAFALFYTGKPDKAIQVMQSNIVATTNPAMLISHYYNLACLYALMNKPDEANSYLKKCIDAGYPKKYAGIDPDLENIRNTQEFKDMIAIK